MSRVIPVALAALLLASMLASTAVAQSQPPASLAPCSALEVRPGAPESDYRCSFPNGQWTALGSGYNNLVIAPSTLFGMSWTQARYEFRNGQLRGINLWWAGNLTTLDNFLRPTFGVANDESHDGFYFYRYPVISNGWQATVSGAPGQWGVSYTDAGDLWR